MQALYVNPGCLKCISDFANNIFLSHFFFFFSIIDSYFLISAGIAQILNPIAELVISVGIPTKEAKAEIDTQPVIAEAEMRKCSKEFRFLQTFYSSVHFDLFLQFNNFLFRAYFLI